MTNLSRKNALRWSIVFGLLSTAQSCTDDICWTFSWNAYTYLFKNCRCVIFNKNCGVNKKRGGLRGPFCNQADGTSASRPECCSDLTVEEQVSRLKAGQDNPQCSSSCSNYRVTQDGVPPPQCPQPPIQDQIENDRRINASVEISVRSLAEAEALVGGGPRKPGLPPAQAATAGKGPAVPAPQVPLAFIPKADLTAQGGGAAGSGGSGGASGFSASGTQAAVDAEARVAPNLVSEQSGLPSGGGGSAARPRRMGEGEEYAKLDSEDVNGDAATKQESLLFKGAKSGSSWDEDPNYWSMIPRESDLFRVVELRYRKNTLRNLNNSR